MNISNAAVVIIDNVTHEVKAYIGSGNFSDASDGGQVDGIQSVRQPGSTLKPLLYALSFDHGLLTPKSIITDVPINFNGYQPENYDQTFHGYVTAEYALENSLNVPAVKALNELGKQKMIGALLQCNFKRIKKDEKKLGLSLILGGCGVTLEEMTALFSVFASKGRYYNIVYEKGGERKDTGQQIISPSAAYMVNEILSRVARPDLPVNWEASAHLPRIAWKTGTSYGRRDAWSIGYNKRYTVGVWVGNFSGEGVQELNGASIATPLLFKVFNTIDYNSSNEWFAMPKETGIRWVCSATGKLPGEYCTNPVMDAYIPMVSDNKTCGHSIEIAISTDEKISYCSSCMPEAGYKKKVYRNTEPEMQTYFEERRIAYDKMPPHNPLCERVFTEGAPQITSPNNNAEYLIDATDLQPIMLSCHTTADAKKLFWFVDNRPVATVAVNNKAFFMPSEGSHKISCTDDKGRNSNVFIKVRFVKM
jgi:penicillin-binding protein 1C